MLMKTNDSQPQLPPNVAQKLRSIRRRALVLALLEGLAHTGAILIGAMLVAMLIDLAVGWLDPLARYTVTSVALGSVAILFLLWCALPFIRRRTIVSTAREVDQNVPQLEERWSTVTELAQNNDRAEVRGSQAMINQVGSEAELASASINPESVVSAKPLFLASRWFLGAAAALVVLVLVNFSQARVLLHRFWLPGDNVSLTELSVSPADVWVPKGEALTLNATVKGSVPKSAPKLSIRPASGASKEIAMSAKTTEKGAFQHLIGDVSDSFEYRARAGDGQTAWHRITAVDRPEITGVKLTVTPPSYSNLPKEEKDSLPQGVRVLQGSEVALGFKCEQPLDKMFLDLGNGRAAQLTNASEHWYEYRSRSMESIAFAAVAINKYQLENKNKPSSRISVYEDLPPSVKVLAPDEVAVLPGEKVNVTFEATDDFGVAKAELTVTTTTADGETKAMTLPVNLGGEEGKKQLRKSVELDPAALGLKQGDQLTYVVKVTDTKQTPTEAGAESQSESKSTSSESQSKEPGKPSELAANEPQSKELEKAEASAERDDAAKSPEASDKENKPSEPEPSSLAAKASDQPQEPKPAGSQPPPNEMSKRMLDAGQCSSCKACKVTVDEWAGTFEGEKRKKLEIAIAPVLEQLDKLLKTADAKTNLLKPAAASPEGLQQKDAEPLQGAKINVTESEGAIAGLKSRTAGTPYAFAGLQLHNIGEAHVTPAHKNLDQVSIAASPVESNAKPVDQASFHIGRAREMLADLTRTFEKVKREQKIADAMQKLAKMHQVFIEDTQAMLGGKKGANNSYDRKIAEVNDEFVEKLKALLEEKKKVLAELSKLLSEDPRLLRRYLAMQQLQASSYRDQMTLLAERQTQMQKQVATWNAKTQAEQTALLPQLKQEYAASQRKVVQDATTLRENMETWLPLDVKPEEKQVGAALDRAEKIIELTAKNTQAETSDTGNEALNEMRSLRENLSQINQTATKDKPRMATYLANRQVELESLITSHSGQMVIQASLNKGDFAKVAEVTQHGIAQETTALSQKLEATEKQVARLSEEISAKAALLNKTVSGDIIPPQGTTVAQLAQRDIKSAGEALNGVVPAFALAEQTFDELMRLIIAKLDEAPAPSAPGEAPQLDALMAMLQDEMKACESLGIPCRPMNVTINSDWMKPGSGMGQGMGQAQAQAAQAQAQKAKADAERLEKQARENAGKAAQAAIKKDAATVENSVATNARDSAWNKLASRLQKDLLQGRDNTPPEQYRTAIDNYFKIISETTNPVEK